MVRLAVIGLGSAWETRHRSALERLHHRSRITVVFDPVYARARQVSEELGVATGAGLLATADRSDVDAVLLLDAGWYEVEAVRLLCSVGKPVYIAADVGRDSATLQALHWTAMSFGLTLMPEFQLRYTPASGRLQELMATRLGPPKQVSVDLSDTGLSNGAFHREAVETNRCLLRWLDWLRYVTRSTPRSIAIDSPSSEESIRVAIEFTKSGGDVTVPTELRLRSADESRERPEIHCERGIAVIESPTVIRWDSDEASEVETLSMDRNETEVMLDHFCRRVVGGLIPVADLSDVSQALAVVDALWQGYETGRPVELDAGVHSS